MGLMDGSIKPLDVESATQKSCVSAREASGRRKKERSTGSNTVLAMATRVRAASSR